MNTERQPVHTVYGGAHLFKPDTARRLGDLARREMALQAPDFTVFARALGLAGADLLPAFPDQAARLAEFIQKDPERSRKDHRAAWAAHTIYTRVIEKLEREPVEDYRIDFEDGYGYRSPAEEDGHAAAAAEAVSRSSSLPPFIGIRIKPLTGESRTRALRTFELFFRKLDAIPAHFIVTLPKVTAPEQVAELAALLPWGVRLEIMIETPEAVRNARALVDAAGGRCRAAHFGAYDYTASLGIAAAFQSLLHPACDFARQQMQLALADTGVWLVDGATNTLPVPVHPKPEGSPARMQQLMAENWEAVHRAWRIHYEDIRHSLRSGFYQSWDLHPAQLPSRYAAVYSFYLENLQPACERVNAFVANAAQATLAGAVFDDAATGRGLLNFFRRAIACGAIGEKEVPALADLERLLNAGKAA